MAPNALATLAAASMALLLLVLTNADRNSSLFQHAIPSAKAQISSFTVPASQSIQSTTHAVLHPVSEPSGLHRMTIGLKSSRESSKLKETSGIALAQSLRAMAYVLIVGIAAKVIWDSKYKSSTHANLLQPFLVAATAGQKGDTPLSEEGALYADDGFQWKGATGSDFEAWAANGYLVDMPEPQMFLVDKKRMAPGGTILLLHGFPSMGFSYRGAIDRLLNIPSKPFSRVLIPDWPGWGHSEKIQPGQGYSYTADEFYNSLHQMLQRVLSEDEKITLVAQGFAVPIALRYLARHAERVKQLVAVNPIFPVQGSLPKLPNVLDIFRNPIAAPILAQDPSRWADIPFSNAGRYMPVESDLAVYRAPFLRDGMAGVTAVATIKALASPEYVAMWEEWRSWIEDYQAKQQRAFPCLLVLGSDDRFTAEKVRSRSEVGYSLGFVSVRRLDGAGHFAQEDWPDGLASAIMAFGEHLDDIGYQG